MAAPNSGPMPPYRLIDNDRVVAAVSREQMATVRFAAIARGIVRVAGVAALVPEGEHDLGHLLSSRQTMHAMWIIEAGCLDQFLKDPAVAGYLWLGVPVMAVFEAAVDYARLLSSPPFAGADQ